MDRVAMVQVGFRLPVDLVNRIEHELTLVSRDRPGLRLCRADVVRELLVQSLDARAEERTPGKKNRKRAG